MATIDKVIKLSESSECKPLSELSHTNKKAYNVNEQRNMRGHGFVMY